MAKIELLDKSVCELIAAGEVVERPSSVVKELVENAIDAGSDKIEVELKRNGLEQIRVTDNGSGIEKSDVKTAFLRHATSKIRSSSDLETISTLGFRGEALAAICAVSRVRLITKTNNSDFGIVYMIEGGEETGFDEVGAPDGTSIFVNELFYNTPARMKFLKTDVHEGNAVEATVEQQALAHPEIAFKLIRDGRTAFQSPGSGDLFSAVFSVFPREVSQNLIEITHLDEKIKVYGLVSKPSAARASRSYQYIFVNGRFVKSKNLSVAVEEACRSLVIAGKYPCFALNIVLPFEDVDINVHPAKTEVRFKNDRVVFSAVYSSVKSALNEFSKKLPDSVERAVEEIKETKIEADEKTPTLDLFSTTFEEKKTDNNEEIDSNKSFFEYIPEKPAEKTVDFINVCFEQETDKYVAESLVDDSPLEVIGEAFDTYVIARCGEDILFVDKHAAHERILYEKIKNSELESVRQILIEPVVVSLSREEKNAVLEHEKEFYNIGFVIEDFADKDVAVREIPTYFPQKAIADAIVRAAAKLVENGGDISTKEREWLLHSSACRAAIKAGNKSSRAELVSLLNDILDGSIPKYCPHGRPVFVALSRKELEKRFGRI